jgi:hypothetical protein
MRWRSRSRRCAAIKKHCSAKPDEIQAARVNHFHPPPIRGLGGYAPDPI